LLTKLVDLQIPEEKSKDGSWVQKGGKPVLALSHQQVRTSKHCRLESRTALLRAAVVER
jgi:hypothetical protein